MLRLVHTDLAGPICLKMDTDLPCHSLMIFPVQFFLFTFSNKRVMLFMQLRSSWLIPPPMGRLNVSDVIMILKFMSKEYQSLLNKNGIRYETSAPYSPHQNGTAQRNWRTLFDMAQCMLIASDLPKTLWPYAVETAAVVRNSCFNNRTKQTPYRKSSFGQERNQTF